MARRPKVMSEDDYLATKGVSDPLSGYLDDKLRSNRQVATVRGREKFNREAKQHIDSYSDKRAAAKREYARLVKGGQIRPPTQLESSFYKAQGNSELRSVQAARRILAKRGYDWKTGKRLPSATRPGPAKISNYKKASTGRSGN